MHIDLIIVPFDSAHRGLRMGAGPEHLVASGLPSMLERLGHLVTQHTVEPDAESWRAEVRTAFELAAAIAGRVSAARAAGRFPLVLAGNCMAALGVVAGLGAGTGVLWFDAHGDFNTPESTTGGFLDGMAISVIAGRCWTAMSSAIPGFVPVEEKDVWLIGARDFDPAEAEALRASAVRHVEVSGVNHTLGDDARRRLRTPQTYVHFDLDVLDPSEGRVNRYATDGGLSASTLRDVFRGLAGTASALTLSAYDPSHDADGRVCDVAMGVLEAFFSESAARS